MTPGPNATSRATLITQPSNPKEFIMALAPGHVHNFTTLKRAFANGDVALMECTDAQTNEPVAVLCMVNQTDDEVQMVPVAKFFTGNPYEELIPPQLGAQEPTAA